MTVVPEPFVSYVGPIVVKENIRSLVIINPTYVTKRVNIPLLTDISEIESTCTPYTIPTKEGWSVRLKGVLPKRLRVKRELIAKILGGVGTGIGFLNTSNLNALAGQIGTMGQDTGSLTIPLVSSLKLLSTLSHDIKKILPEWQKTDWEDDLNIVNTGKRILGNYLH